MLCDSRSVSHASAEERSKSDHLFAELHQRRERLRIATENERKINMEQIAILREHDILEVSIADAEEKRDHAVCTRAERRHGAHSTGTTAHAKTEQE